MFKHLKAPFFILQINKPGKPFHPDLPGFI